MGLFSKRKKRKEEETQELIRQINERAEMEAKAAQLRKMSGLMTQIPQEGLSEEERLVEFVLLAEKDGSLTPAVRKDFLPRIRSDEALYALASRTRDRDLAVNTALQIQSIDLLTRYAAEVLTWGPHRIMERLQNEPDGAERLYRVAHRTKEEKVRESAMEYWAESVNTPQAWLEYARTVKSYKALYHIDDAEVLSKAAVEDNDYIRWGVMRTSAEKLSGEALMAYALREDNNKEMRSKAAELLLKRDWPDPQGQLDALLPDLMEENLYLAFEMAKKGDGRAVPVLKKAALSQSRAREAAWHLGEIETTESVQALLELMQTNQNTGDAAAACLIGIYKRTNDPAVKSAIAAIPRKRYFDHTDAGKHGESCHTDIAAVIFDLEE